MELLLNLVWIAMALAAFSVFARSRRTVPQFATIPYWKALLALACVLVLLFPVISASDDLHPSQAVLEDATKRIQQAVASFQHAQSSLATYLLPVMLVSSLMMVLAGSRFWLTAASEARVMHRERTPRDGRSPPSH